MKKILVLGGTGAMGTPVVQILAERGCDVYVTTRRHLTSEKGNVHYLQGDAHDPAFIDAILAQSFDAIIDFMIYSSDKFEARTQRLLRSTDQYLFFSSARVYADSPESLITEDSPRLLDTTQDAEYLRTDEYALAKAREENALRNGERQNYTIIRPYITYNTERLQLGLFEKEMWLQRALMGKKIVFSRNIASKVTTLTYGYDVALRIADLVGKKCALGQTYHITTGQSILWGDVFDIYLDVLERQLGHRPQVCMTEQSDPLLERTNYYQIHCDREFNRRFDNSKVQRDSAETEPYMDVRKGLAMCLEDFLQGDREFLWMNWKEEAVLDRISGDHSRLQDIPGIKNKIKYVLYRYLIRVR